MKKYNDYSPCFDDILLVPQYSDINSRHEVSLMTSIGKGRRTLVMSLPVIAAPMDTVCDGRMAQAMRELGGLGIIHRFMSIEDQVSQVKEIMSTDLLAVGIATGAKDDYINRAWRCIDEGAVLVLVDTANGHSKMAIDAVKTLRRSFGNNIHIMAGNVATYEGFKMLQDAGADSIRVGIGGGSVCTTRIVSGHGIPTLASILDIREKIPYGEGASIIADGGIRNSGDAVKALAAGADAIMMGSYLAGTDESPGKLHSEDGRQYKIFRGMASAEAQKDFSGKVSVSEGVETTVPYKGPLAEIMKEFKGGLGSGLSYSGAVDLEELHRESMFVEVSSSSVGESIPHAKR